MIGASAGIVGAHYVTSLTYADIVRSDSALGYWRLGDAIGSGTVLDSSGNGRNGVTNGVGNPTFGTAGLLVGNSDTAATFDGVNDHCGIGDVPAWDATVITCEAIIKTSTATGTPQILCRDAAGARSFQFRLASGVLQFIIVNSAGTSAAPVGSINLADGQPHHVAGTYDGATIRQYVDGVQDGFVASSLVLASHSEPLRIGARRSGVGTFATLFTGVIDEVAFYGTALSAARIAAHKAATGF